MKKHYFFRRTTSVFLALALLAGSVGSGAGMITAEAETINDTEVSIEQENLPMGGFEIVKPINISDKSNRRKAPRKYQTSNQGTLDDVFINCSGSYGLNHLGTKQQKFYEALDEVAKQFMISGEKTDIIDGVDDEEKKYYYYNKAANYTDLDLTQEEAIESFYAYDYDHPAYYWIHGIVYSTSSLYFKTDEEFFDLSARAAINEQIISGVKRYAKAADKGDNAFEKTVILHDELVEAVKYAYDENENPVSEKWAHSVIGVFDENYSEAVCEGYADAFSAVLNYLKIPNVYIVGLGNGENHAWNAVSFDNEESYSYIDVTWDDQDKNDEPNKYTYIYFGMPKSSFEKSHKAFLPDNSLNGKWLYELPDNITKDLNGTYYKKSGCYADNSLTDSDLQTFVSNAETNTLKHGRRLSILTEGDPKEESSASRKVGLFLYESGFVSIPVDDLDGNYHCIQKILRDTRHVNPITEFTLSKESDSTNLSKKTYELTIENLNFKNSSSTESDDYIFFSTSDTDKVTIKNPHVPGKLNEIVTIELRNAGEAIIIAQSSDQKIKQTFKLTVENNCNVIFDANGGSWEDNETTKEQDVGFGVAVTKPEEPTKEGYEFISWCSDEELTSEWDFGTEVTEDIKLYAKWKAIEYDITYELDEGKNAPENPSKYTIESEDITLKAPSKDGYVFKGWTEGEESEPKTEVTIKKGSTGERKYTANWEKEAENHEVGFETNGGSAVASQKVKTGEKASEPETTSKEGYVFKGWYKDAELTQEWKFDTYTVTEDMTLYAGWKAEEYAITYVLDDGTNAPENPSKYTVESEDITLKAPTKTGYIFKGWTGDNGTIPQETVTIKKGSTGNKSYTAVWEEIKKDYKVTFESNGGSQVASQTVQSGLKVTQPTAPTKNGYVFKGWYKDAGLTQLWNFDTDTVTSAITLYASWEEEANNTKNYTVTFETNGGSAVTSQTVPSGGKASEPASPTREGYLFAGWYKDAECTSVYDFTNEIIQADTVIYAKWNDAATAVPVNNVSLNNHTIALKIGKTEKLAATVAPENATNKQLRWESNNDKVATVDQEGNVTGVAVGNAVITVTTQDGNKTDTCTVEVTAASENNGNDINNIANATISGVASSYSYTGNAIMPEPTVTLNGKKLTKNVEYTLTYSNLTNVGAASVTITGIGAYTGSIVKEYVITQTAPNNSTSGQGVTGASSSTSGSNTSVSTGGTTPNSGRTAGTTTNSSSTTAGSSTTTSGSTSTGNGAIGTTSTYSNDSSGSTTNANNSGSSSNSGDTSELTTGSTVSSSKVTYKVSSDQSDTVTVSSTSKTAKKVVVPSYVTNKSTNEKYKVTAVAKNAFKNHTALKSVTIGSNVKTIGANAFSNCKNLLEITIYAKNLKKIGKNAFKGVKEGAVVKIEAKSMAQYKKLKKQLKNAGLTNVKFKYRIK